MGQPSKEKALVRLPTTALAVIRTSFDTPSLLPTKEWHVTEVREAQAEVVQLWAPRPPVGVRLLVRKSTPDTVTTPPDVVTVLSGSVKLTTGAGTGRAEREGCAAATPAIAKAKGPS